MVAMATARLTVESIDAANSITQLAQAGEQKANFKARLIAAVDVLQKAKAREKIIPMKTIQDQNKFLRSICENKQQPNSHNLGMVE